MEVESPRAEGPAETVDEFGGGAGVRLEGRVVILFEDVDSARAGREAEKVVGCKHGGWVR